MSTRNQIAKLRHDLGQARMNDDVREISKIMDELSAGAAGGINDPEKTLEQLMDQLTDDPQ